MSTQPAPASDQSDREIVLTRILHAPRELVWQAWTDPEHVVNWWGPRGFTTKIETMDLRVGGVWKHVMIGPDGIEYPNMSVFREIVPLERIVYSHGGARKGGPGANFTATWTFETVEGNRTRLTGRMVFPSAEDRDIVAREYGAVEGGRQTLERLSEHLPAMQSRPFVITHTFDAPRDVVWRAWTDREQLMQWFGAKGFTMTVATQDLRPGGIFHYAMRSDSGLEMWGRFAYREIVPPAKLIWINSFSDPEGGIAPHAFSPDPWPLQILTTVNFTDDSGRTTVTVTWLPIEATDEERRHFDAGHDSMRGGWGGVMERLGTHLAAASGPRNPPSTTRGAVERM